MKISAITPTKNRPQLLERCIDQFLKQDWEDKELIIVADVSDTATLEILRNYGPDEYANIKVLIVEDSTIGAKLNHACEVATGEVIIRLDDDDMYSPFWFANSIYVLDLMEADIVGLKNFNLYDAEQDIGYRYTYQGSSMPYVAGATQCFRRSFWERNKYPERNIGEDTHFILDAVPQPKIYNHNYIEGFLCSIHKGNTSRKMVENQCYGRLSEVELGVAKTFISL